MTPRLRGSNLSRLAKWMVLTSRQLVEIILEAGREPVERDPLYNVVSRGLEGVTGVETLLSDQKADLIQPLANVNLLSSNVVTASQKLKDKARDLIALKAR